MRLKRLTPDHVYQNAVAYIESILKDRRGLREPHNESEQLMGMLSQILRMQERDSERDERDTYERLKRKFEPTAQTGDAP